MTLLSEGISISYSPRRVRISAAGWWLCILTAVLLGAVFFASLCIGKIAIAPAEVGRALLGHASSAQIQMLVYQMRLPRVIAAMAVGAGLAASGLLMQTVMRNPMATPSVLGLGNGAQLGLLLALILAPGASEIWPTISACVGAFLVAAAIGTISIGNTARMDRDFVVVGGMLLGGVLGSATTGIMLVHHMNGALSDWHIGILTKISWARVSIALPLVTVGVLIAGIMIHRIEVLSLGRTVAESLGVQTRLYLLGAMGAVVLMGGASVAIAGPVAYVGLVVPHVFSRQRVRDPAMRLLACLLGGALLTSVADLLTRSFDAGRVIPMGIWTMSLGAIFFFAMTLRGPQARSREI